MSHVLIFEPWTLGDVVVAASVARHLNGRYKISIIAAPQWEAWLQTLGIFAFVIPFHIPWTDQKKKYDFTKYQMNRFVELRRWIHGIRPDVILDLRGDVRNIVFLRVLNVAPVKSLWRRRPANVYGRVNGALGLLGQCTVGENSGQVDKIRNQPKSITCFFGATWFNRRVPRDLALQIVKELSELCPVNLLLQPSEPVKFWIGQNISGLHVCQVSVVEAAEIVKKSTACVCTDSGWLHMAYFYGVPRVALLGFDTSQEWMPPDTSVIFSEPYFPANVRYRRRFRDLNPLKNLSVPKVIEAIREVLTEEVNPS